MSPLPGSVLEKSRTVLLSPWRTMATFSWVACTGGGGVVTGCPGPWPCGVPEPTIVSSATASEVITVYPPESPRNLPVRPR